MELRIYQIDAFSEYIFGGNPAAVVPLSEWLADELMQNIAAENNLAETAFLVPAGSDGNTWHIRWFTPAVEVPLCGHATLASAAVIRREFSPTEWPIRLESASGLLTVDIDDDALILDFPANEASPAELPDGLADALGIDYDECFHVEGFYLLTVSDEASVKAIRPDFSRMTAISKDSMIVTAPGNSVDFVSRFFAPGIGINEDPVTGAAHCVLTPYWSKRLKKNEFQARQVSPRGGNVGCELRGDRVRLRGHAAFYMDGMLTI